MNELEEDDGCLRISVRKILFGPNISQTANLALASTLGNYYPGSCAALVWHTEYRRP